MMRQQASQPFHIAVIGGGFSGTMVVAQLIKKSEQPFKITLFDTQGRFAQGIAYSTACPEHLLNVPAIRMGAWADKPDHFYQWLLQKPEAWHRANSSYEKYQAEETSFMPRQIYGLYLADQLQAAVQLGKSKGIEIELLQAEVVDGEFIKSADRETIKLHLLNGNSLQVNAAILTLGNMPSKVLSKTGKGISRLWEDPWKLLKNEQEIQKLDFLENPQATIVCVGTGLTTVDAIASLHKRDFKGQIIALSPHGLFPQVHRLGPAWNEYELPSKNFETALQLSRWIRQLVQKAKGSGINWRSVIDGLRPVTQKFWQALPDEEKKKATRRLLTWWNVHRHRMPPESAAILEKWKVEGRLKIIQGRCVDVKEDVLLTVLYQQGRQIKSLENVSIVLNCTGPDFSSLTHPLIKNLLEKEVMVWHSAGMGIQLTQSNGPWHLMGPLQMGELLETTAIPELRQQAALTADRCLEYLRQID